MSLEHSPSKQARRLRRAAASAYLKETWGLDFPPVPSQNLPASAAAQPWNTPAVSPFIRNRSSTPGRQRKSHLQLRYVSTTPTANRRLKKTAGPKAPAVQITCSSKHNILDLILGGNGPASSNRKDAAMETDFNSTAPSTSPHSLLVVNCVDWPRGHSSEPSGHLLGPPLWPVADICPACGRVGLRQEAGTITTLIRFPAVIGRLDPAVGFASRRRGAWHCARL